MTVSLIVVGGFLGAGKTTSILALSRYFILQGKKIGIVTNDQGHQLVDTEFLTSEGLPVLEVTGGCFCCNFDEFTDKVNRLAEDEMPDIILAEPVGSCTDLIATIFKPIQAEYTSHFSLSPLSIVVDPRRVKKLIMGGLSPFPDEINYLFKKQLEEADIIVLNKTDLIPEHEVSEITSFLRQSFKGTEIKIVSAKNGTGIPEWASEVYSHNPGFNTIKDIDYDTYASAEEYLGWLNSSALLDIGEEQDINGLVGAILEGIRGRLSEDNNEIAHLKVYGISGSDWVKASITSNDDSIDYNRKMEKKANSVSLIVNARVDIEPEKLKAIVENELLHICLTGDISISNLNTESFKPSYPKPKFRIG